MSIRDQNNIGKNHVESSPIFHRFWKSTRRRVIHVESMSFFPCGFAFYNRWNADELSTWKFDVESMVNRRRCTHWESKLTNIKFYKLICRIIIICTFLWYLLVFVYFFYPKNSTSDSRKTFITQKWLVAESYPTTPWIAFLMLYRLVYNVSSYFNELILAWSAYERQAARRVKPSRNDYNLVKNLVAVTTT